MILLSGDRTKSQVGKMNKVEQVVYDKLSSAMDKGVVPWRRPCMGHYPANLISGKRYRGMNVLLLWAFNDFKSSYYLTLKQVKELGGRVIYEQFKNGFPIVYWTMFDKEVDGKIKQFPFMRYYYVYNTEQCENISHSRLDAFTRIGTDLFDISIQSSIADNIIKDYQFRQNVKIVFERPGAFYSPYKDVVNITDKSQFVSESAYYSTLFHELVHSTGNINRQNRFAKNRDCTVYAHDFEELVAEIGAAFLCAHCGIEQEFENNAAYLQSWMEVFKDDKNMLLKAAGKAQLAVDLILNTKFNIDNKEYEEVNV